MYGLDKTAASGQFLTAKINILDQKRPADQLSRQAFCKRVYRPDIQGPGKHRAFYHL